MSIRNANERAEAFERLYGSMYRDIVAYATRRVSLDEADDVVAKIFMVAWRRFDDVPEPPQDRLWLFGVARRCVADQLRSGRRQMRLYSRVSQEQATMNPSYGPTPDDRYDLVQAAMESMKPADREALQLVLWEGLSHAEAATVMGCSVNAFELRYRRARNTAREAVESATARHQLSTAQLPSATSPLLPKGMLP